MAPPVVPMGEVVDESTLTANARGREAEMRAERAEAELRARNAEMRARAAEEALAQQKRGFIAATAFEGARTGFAFKMGSQGLGYYIEAVRNQAPTHEDADERLAHVRRLNREAAERRTAAEQPGAAARRQARRRSQVTTA